MVNGKMGKRSLAIMPVFPSCSLTSSPVIPCRYTPHDAASNGDKPCASNPAIAPASTSPVPAEASPGLATALIRALPSGAATMVCAPLRMTVFCHVLAASLAVSSRRDWI